MRITRYTLLMLIYFAAAGGLMFYFYPDLERLFKETSLFCGAILGIAVVGVLISVRGFFKLWHDNAWFEAFKSNTLKQSRAHPYSLTPLRSMFITRKRDLTPDVVKDCLESIGDRLCSMRLVSRHMIWLPVIVGVFGSISLMIEYADKITPFMVYNVMGEGQVNEHMQILAFNAFMHAFETFLLGLGVSILLAILDLNYGLAQASCFAAVEDWLFSCMKTMSRYGVMDKNETTPSTLMKALITRTACTVDRLAKAYEEGETSTSNLENMLHRFSQQLDRLGSQMKIEQRIMLKMAENQVELQSSIRQMVQAMSLDDGLKEYLDKIESGLRHMAEDMDSGRRRAAEDIRQELRLLTHAFAAAKEPEIVEEAA